MATSKRKDFTQTALDVVRQTTGETIKTTPQAEKANRAEGRPWRGEKARKEGLVL